MEQIKEQKSSSLNAMSIGYVLKAYRTITGSRQDEMALDISQYLQDRGLSTGNISQGTIAKLEKGSLTADFSIVSYINDRILGSDMDVKMEIFPLIDKIINITEVEPEEILELLHLKDKSELNGFIKNHIRKEIEPDKAKINNFVYESIIAEKLELFSNSIIIEEQFIDQENITVRMNSTATLMLYLAFNYIQSLFSVREILCFFTEKKYSSTIKEDISGKEASDKQGFIEFIESEILKEEEHEQYALLSKVFWEKSASRIAKSKRVITLLILLKPIYYMMTYFPEYIDDIDSQEDNSKIDLEVLRQAIPILSKYYKDPLLLMKEFYNGFYKGFYKGYSDALHFLKESESDKVCSRLYERIKQELETKILNNNTENIELFIKYIEFIYNDKNISCVDKKNQLSVIAQYLNIPYNTLYELAIGSEK